MNFHFTGKNVLKKGFSAPSLKDYANAALEKLKQPLSVPPYATAGESERITSATEKLQEKPFAGRTAFNESAKEFGNLTPVSYGKYPTMYDICMHAHEVLGSPLPVLYVFDGVAYPSLAYQAMACDYLEHFYLYVSSRYLDEADMATQAELCFIVGHELGHTQCHHTTIKLLTGDANSNREYSADRAGLLVAASWLRSQHPDWPMDKIAMEAVYSAGTILEKLTIGFTAVAKKTSADWSQYDVAAAREKLDKILQNPTSLQPYSGTHPSDEHRVMALYRFAKSELFYKLMDAEIPSGLYNDTLLEELMRYHIQA